MGMYFFAFRYRCFKRSLNKENCISNDEFYLMQRFLGKGGGGIREGETKKPAL